MQPEPEPGARPKSWEVYAVQPGSVLIAGQARQPLVRPASLVRNRQPAHVLYSREEPYGHAACSRRLLRRCAAAPKAPSFHPRPGMDSLYSGLSKRTPNGGFFTS